MSSPQTRKGLSYRLLSVLLSLVLLLAGIAVLYQRIDWRNVTEVWAKLDTGLVALAVAVYWFQCPWNALRLERVIRWATGRGASDMPRFDFLFRLTCSAGFVAVAAPVGLAGDAAKIAALRAFGTLSLTDAARCALFDRVIGVQWLCLSGLVSLPFQAAAGVPPHVLYPQLIIFSGMMAAIGMLLILPRMLRLIRSEFVFKIARVFADDHRATTLGSAGSLTIDETLAVSIVWGAVLIMSNALNGVFLIGHWQSAGNASRKRREG